MLNIGSKAVLRFVQDGDPLAYLRAKLSPQLFKPGDELAVYEYVQNHVQKFRVLPQIDTVIQQFPILKEQGNLEPTSYYLDKLLNRFEYETINRTNLKSQEILTTDKSATDEALALMTDAHKTIIQQRFRQQIMDVGKEAKAFLLNNYYGMAQQDVPLVLFGWPYLDDMVGTLLPGDVYSIVGRIGKGKASTVDSKVLTTSGFVRMGDIKVGDELASVDGRPSKVTGVFPQGTIEAYRVTFADGRSAEVSGDHLWETFFNGGGWPGPKIETTLQVMNRLKTHRYSQNLSVRLFSGEFGTQVPSLFSPYLLGVLIGDGGMTKSTPTLTNTDPQLLDRVRKELMFHGLTLNQTKSDLITYYVTDVRYRPTNRVTKWLRDLGLHGKKSDDKFIPKAYLSATREERLLLLQGLMDTDGTCGKTGACYFATSSPQLALDVRDLVRSLGGQSSISVKKTTHLDCYRVVVKLQNRRETFHLDRKRDRVLNEQGPKHSIIKSVEAIGPRECQCIAVDHPDHLYVTDDYVVTHNTWFALFTALHNWRVLNRNVMFVSMEMNNLAIVQRIGAMYTGSPYLQLKHGKMATGTLKSFVNAIGAMDKEPGHLYVVNGNLMATVEELYTLAIQLGVQVIVIDGAYLMKHPNKRLDRYTKVAENVELMKQASEQLEIVTGASWQFAKTAAKKNKAKGEKETLEDIGYSDAIAQTSSIVLGLMEEEGVETMTQRKIELLKGRSGEVGQFYVNWNFDRSDFSQIEDTSKQLEYL